MSASNDRERSRDQRSSALWGTGGRGGEGRSSALWGKGGRGFVLTAVAVLALAAPMASTAGNGSGTPPGQAAFVAPDLLAKAKSSPNEKIRVIIQSTAGADTALQAARSSGQADKVRRLDVVGGTAVELNAKQIEKLAQVPGLSIVPDAPVKTDDLGLFGAQYTSSQLWPYANGDAWLWYLPLKGATIAVVDSGIDASRADFGGRVVANVNLSQLSGNTAGTDGRGHGTFVAGIAAGSGPGRAGVSPKADLVSLDVMDDQGMALTSDVIAACDWLLQNKAAYNIKVANFSLHSTYPSNFGHDPLDQAVEKLWFGGITVVAAAGNYGNSDGTPSGVRYAPGNDPFVITVGAVDLGSSGRIGDDNVAYWSAYGYTYDGFWKPEIGAAGRYMVGAVPPTSTLPAERPDKVRAPGYMELSGTSFSAPVVAGTASQLLARHPSWTPDQVKGALMMSARPIPQATNGQGGVGQINAVRATLVGTPANPNRGLERFLTADPAGGPLPVFDAVSWYDAAQADVSWNSVSWADVSWADVSWNSVSWASVSWNSVSWADVSWADVSWADVSWADTSKEDAVMDEPGNGGVDLTDTTAADLAGDPDLNLDPSVTDPALDALLADTTTVDATTTVATTTTP